MKLHTSFLVGGGRVRVIKSLKYLAEVGMEISSQAATSPVTWLR